eukprot:scaffold23_cov101-Skeletonema_dohrnii-CCMP3373.AAC.5
MVTRTVIRITSSEAAAFAAAATSSAAVNSSITSNAPAEQKNTKELQTNLKLLCNHPSCTKRAQDPSLLCWQHGAKESICSYSGCHNKGILLGLCADHGGLVQLCRQKGCINEVDFERRGSLCYIHQTGDQSDSDDSEEDGEIHLCSFRGCISSATTDEGLCDGHAAHVSNYGLDAIGKKRDRPSEDSIISKDNMKRQKVDAFDFDLSDVPPQPPIPKSAGRIKEGTSKYTGVSYNKPMKKWQAKIYIEGEQRHIGHYENEEEAAVDCARAVFKYKGQGALDKAREQRARDISSERKSIIIDLSDVPPQPSIPKSEGRIKDGASKYTGVHFNKPMNKWQAQISIDGKRQCIGYYDNEEEAAADYARAVFKYKGQGVRDKARETKEENSSFIDLSNVPPQPPIPKSAGHNKEGASKYTGVTFYKPMNKWKAQIYIDGKQRGIGYYDNEEEAAADYARAVFKYKGQGALDKARETKEENSSFIIDLSNVPPQHPIPKSGGYIKEGASKYNGVTFSKAMNKWQAQISIDGKQRLIGYYESEEAAAADYARAVFKYRGQGQGALDKARETKEEKSSFIDLSDVPPQPPIPKSAGRIKEGASKYTGVFFDKQMNKWTAQISIEGKQRHIGYYDNEEEAAIDFARAVFKYKEKRKIDKIRRFILTKNSIL